MANTCWNTRLKKAAWIGLLGMSVAAVCIPGMARAQDDDQDSIWNLNQRVVKGLMNSLGLRDGSEADIDYRERSPLVVPPNDDLPPPEKTAAPNNPAWPVDPDVKRRADVKKRTKTYLTGTVEDDRALMPSELDSPSVIEARRRAQGSNGATPGNDHNMSPSELGYVGGLFSLKSLGFGKSADEVGTFKQEPTRDSLSEPPVGYQTPSPTQPYGVTKRNDKKPAKYDPAVGVTGN